MSQKGKKVNIQQEIEKQNMKIVFIRICILLFIAIILIMSTYAWFTSQKDITISNLRGTVEVVENMEVSLDAKMWYHYIDLSEMQEDKTKLQIAYEDRNSVTSGTAPNIEPTQLLPVSTVGGVGGLYLPLYKGEAKTRKVTSLNDIKQCIEFDENKQAKDNGYFAYDIYIKNTSRDGEPDVLQLNLNSSLQILEEKIEKEITINGVTTKSVYEGNKSSGLQNAMRVGIALYEDTVDTMAGPKEILEKTKDSKISKVAIWEPNAPYHVSYVVENNNKLTGSKAVKFKNGDILDTYALTSKTIQKIIDDVYNTDNPNLAVQSALKTEIADTTEGSEDYRILSNAGKPWNISDTDGEKFTIESNKISRLRIYVWLEGQDVDCINLASLGGGIQVDLGFTKDDAVGEVLKENPTQNGGSEPAEPTEP